MTSLNSKSYKEIWLIAYPLLIMSASQTIMQFIDRKFLSMSSTEEVAAALPAGILFFTMICPFFITTRFTAAIVGQFYGKKDLTSCVRVVWSSFYFAVFIGIFCLAVFPPIGSFIISLAGHSSDIMAYEKSYFNALVPGGIFLCASAAFCSFFTGRGKTWIVTIIYFSACLVNIGLDYLIIFGNFGFPKLGITGAGIATCLADAFAALVACIVFLSQNQSKYPTRQNSKQKISDIKRLVKFGGPTGIQVFGELAAFTSIIFLIGYLGEIELAATTIAMSINMFAFMPLLSLSEATTIISSKYIGKKQDDKAEKTVYTAFKMACIYMSIMALIFLLLPDYLYSFFTPKSKSNIDFTKVIDYGKIILTCMAVYSFSDAIHFVFLGGLRGAGDTKYPMWMSISIAWLLQTPIIIISIFILNLSLAYIWILFTLCMTINGVLMYLRFKSGKWKHVKMIKEKS